MKWYMIKIILESILYQLLSDIGYFNEPAIMIQVYHYMMNWLRFW